MPKMPLREWRFYDIMNPPPIDDPFPLYDIFSEFLPPPNFGESFHFDEVIAASDSSFYGGYDDESCSMSVEGYVELHHRRRCRRTRQRKNRYYHKDSVLLSPWYINFLCPGIIHDLTHELSSSDRFGKFRSLFQMPLSKVEELTDILINQGYIFVLQDRSSFKRCFVSGVSYLSCRRFTALETVTHFISVVHRRTSAYLR